MVLELLLFLYPQRDLAVGFLPDGRSASFLYLPREALEKRGRYCAALFMEPSYLSSEKAWFFDADSVQNDRALNDLLATQFRDLYHNPLPVRDSLDLAIRVWHSPPDQGLWYFHEVSRAARGAGHLYCNERLSPRQRALVWEINILLRSYYNTPKAAAEQFEDYALQVMPLSPTIAQSCYASAIRVLRWGHQPKLADQAYARGQRLFKRKFPRVSPAYEYWEMGMIKRTPTKRAHRQDRS